MYLKSIEMQGFKSFAGKTKLDFHNGVTGIVGPNGSGKSNVGDAVRWVLGEQSAKQLRGGNMQDVIFAGTEARKPLGYASVAITLDNGDRKLNLDADEITVTRRLYRSGESEYLLNGRNCRLRDINELFYDTGIGKEGYSIIGQGQIDKILSGKPDDRRELFDEAAGIVKFKRRKAASLKKLEEEQSNLVRVTDILSEITRQLGPLERQAKKAEEYLGKRDHLRDMEIRLFQIDTKRNEEQLTELADSRKIAGDQLAELDAALEQTRAEYDRVEKEIDALDTRIREKREESQSAALQREQADGQVNVLREQIRAFEANRKIYEERLAAIDEETSSRRAGEDAQREERKQLLDQLEAARVEKEAKEQEVSRLNAEIEGRSRETEQSRKETIELLNSRSSIKTRIQRYDTMLEQIGIRRSEQNSRMLQMRSEGSKGMEKLSALEEELKRISGEVAAKREEITAAEKQEVQLKLLINEQNRQLEAAQTSFHRESSRLESLKNITERYEGYGNSIKKVMEQKENNPGIHGVIADLIKTQKKYETAIETALGGSLQNIVTDNEATAKYLIEYLKRGHFGRATFLPLTAMREDQGFENREVLKENGVIGKADELVSCDKIYRGVARRLLGRTVVVDTIDHAIGISRKYRQSVRMVTLEGELLSPGGSMTGGSFKYNSNLLGRRRQIQELESSVKALKKETEELSASIEENRIRRNKIRALLSEKNDELQKLYLEQNTAKLNWDAGKERADALGAEYQKLQKELLEIENQVAEITDKRGNIRTELESSQTEEKALEDRIRSLSDETEILRGQEQQAAKAQDEARLVYANLQQQAAFIKERIATAESELARLEEERENASRGLLQESGDADKKQLLIDDLEKEIQRLSAEIEECSSEAARRQEEKDALNQEHRAFFERRDELAGQKSEMEKEIFRLENQIERLQEQMESQVNYLYEEYQITPDQAEAVTFSDMPERTPLKKEIAEVKGEIKALGSINVNAVEEYRELKERHDFLSAQHEDLVKAAEQLQGIIKELDEGMRRQFRERFDQIRVEFDKVFRQLFGGGKGTLELIEGEDILESGIVIISQPPGKKLQNMMQLSGGEKALTAIALLFAIQNLKPSPFCLLDEIEAALDDNNVGRFAKYLHKLTKNTQFIVITHRRGTMAAADRLYGITMQEKGVSALVSVNLVEAQLDN